MCTGLIGRGVSTPRLLEWITYPIFSAPAAHRPLLGPRQWSHVGSERRKNPCCCFTLKKKTTGSISINHKPLQFAFLNLEATSRHFQVHVETGYIPIPKKKKNPGFLLVSPLQKQSLLENNMIIHTGRARKQTAPCQQNVLNGLAAQQRSGRAPHSALPLSISSASQAAQVDTQCNFRVMSQSH